MLHVVGSGPAGGMGGGGGGGPGRKLDTVGKKALVGVAVGYMALIVIFPFINVFIEVRSAGPCAGDATSPPLRPLPRSPP